MTAELATLADAPADQAQGLPAAETLSDPRPGSASVDQTTREMAEDLRTMARHLRNGHLLLEPADDDLAHPRSQIPAPATPAREQPRTHRGHPYADHIPAPRRHPGDDGPTSTTEQAA